MALLICRLVAALPTAPPPMRKKTSWIELGFALWSSALPGGPSRTSTGELAVPASISNPAIFTPSTSATCKAVTPLSASSVARPRPSSTVLALSTASAASSL